jgi:MFS transporter, DHA3 family, macrolide efflux protein
VTDGTIGLKQLLRIGDFRRLLLAQIVSDVGDALTFVTLLFLVQRLTGSTVALAGLAISITIPSLVFGLLAGVYVDRWDRRKVMLYSDLARGVIVLGLVWVQSDDLLWLVYLIAFSQAAIGTLFYPAKTALLPHLVGEKNLLAANSISQTSDIIFSLVGTIIAGLLAGYLTNLWPAFAIDAATFFISAAFISRIAARPPKAKSDPGETDQSVWADLSEGFRQIAQSRPLLGVVMAGSIAMLGLGAVNVLMVPFILEELAVSESWFGLIEAAQVLGMVISGITVAALAAKFRLGNLMVAGLVMAGVMIAAISGVTAIWQLMAVLTVIGLAVVPVQTAATTLLQTLASDEMRGRVSSSMGTAVSAASIVSIGFAGILAAAIGVRGVFVVSGAITVVAGTIAWFVFRGTSD